MGDQTRAESSYIPDYQTVLNTDLQNTELRSYR
jgi:hypothetical protein